jgi:hypothetical protein
MVDVDDDALDVERAHAVGAHVRQVQGGAKKQVKRDLQLAVIYVTVGYSRLCKCCSGLVDGNTEKAQWKSVPFS